MWPKGVELHLEEAGDGARLGGGICRYILVCIVEE